MRLGFGLEFGRPVIGIDEPRIALADLERLPDEILRDEPERVRGVGRAGA